MVNGRADNTRRTGDASRLGVNPAAAAAATTAAPSQTSRDNGRPGTMTPPQDNRNEMYHNGVAL